jgi:hypothetical protein
MDMRFILALISGIGLCLVAFYLEMARFIASDPVNRQLTMVDWPVPLALALVSTALTLYFIRELVRDLRGYYR